MEHLLKEQFNDDDKEKYVEDPGAQPITHNSVNGGLVFQGIPLVVLKGQAYEMTQSVDDRSITTKNWWNVLDLVDAYKESGFYSINIMLGVLESRYKTENDFDLMRMKYLRDKFGDSFLSQNKNMVILTGQLSISKRKAETRTFGLITLWNFSFILNIETHCQSFFPNKTFADVNTIFG